MTVRFNSKLIDAAPNVVRLPTAAPRQVKQNYNRKAFEARKALRADHPWPGEYLAPIDRESDRLAGQLRSIQQTPALVLVSAILHAMDAEAYNKIAEQIAPGAVGGRDVHKQAFATLRASRMTVGEQHYLFNALARLDREGC